MDEIEHMNGVKCKGQGMGPLPPGRIVLVAFFPERLVDPIRPRRARYDARLQDFTYTSSSVQLLYLADMIHVPC